MPPRRRGRGQPAARGLGRGRGRERVQEPHEPEVASNASLFEEVLEEPPRAHRRVEPIEGVNEQLMRQMSDMMLAVLQEVIPVVPPAPLVAPPVPDLLVMAPLVHVPPPVAPAVPIAPQRRVIDHGRVTMFSFMKLNLPIFKGEQGDDPCEFIEKVDVKVKHLPCSETPIIELMSLQLEDDAKSWYERKIDERVHGDNPFTWEEFKEKFLDEYITEGLKKRNKIRFE